MTSSPLQLNRYFVTEAHLMARKEFKAAERVSLGAEQLDVESDCKSVENNRHWEVSLRIKFQSGPELNSPYSFTIEVVGFFTVLVGYAEEKIDCMVRTNGPSMLYGVARELIRQMTSSGPHPQVLLPSVSFMPQKSERSLVAESVQDVESKLVRSID